MRKIVYSLALVSIAFSSLFSQEEDEKKGHFSGNFQIDAQTYMEDTITGADKAPEIMLMNSYANLRYTYGKLTAGLRFESYLNTLQGISNAYDGTGIPYKFFNYKSDELEFTVGNFYEQFGSGMSLRAYEDKTLGIDNAFEGVLVRHNPHKGIYLKGLVGKQRLFFDLGPGIVRGADAEIQLNEAFKLDSVETQITLGGSFVSRYQADRNPILKLPENVAIMATRLSVQRGGFSIVSEYGYKINDPSADNLNNYQPGQAIMSDISFTKGTFGMVVGGKWLNNMSFRSSRSAQNNDLMLNYLPAISKNHIYSLPAMYPYATQLNGEAGIKAEIFYRLKPKTLLGGKYGTLITLNYSRVQTIDTTNLPMLDSIRPHWNRYETSFLSIGDERLYEDISIDIQKKLSKRVKSFFSLQYSAYNRQYIEGKDGMIEAFIFVGDMTFSLKPKHALRAELQFLSTKQDYGDWVTAALEYTVSPHWFVALVDQYNFGNSDSDKQLHYYMVRTGYTKGANRIQIGYGRQRQGVICIGGVCRMVPASTGFNISISSTF
ncbi:MAG: DUF6029 family protein [Salinivirgaceae bacterium]|nr:DUF6029 family protein [Salinivirgaceae bacterium]MDD4746203.1 DUF6029 family protein [Salinivirgaceae bacterium]MDY0280786.1 DUF6029 family protein [Salinivirgaceae bacterium]